MFSVVPTTKPANDSRSTFLGVFGFHVIFECLSFFLSISYYTGSFWLTFSVFSLLFFCQMSKETIIIIFDFVAIYSYLQGLMVFKSLRKSSAAHILAQYLQMFSFENGLWTSVYYLVYIVCYFATKLKENTK